jgi:hypothetical protein
MSQIHKRFRSEQVVDVLKKYEEGKIERKIIEAMLGIKKSRFFELMKEFRGKGREFKIDYARQAGNNVTSEKREKYLYNELVTSKELIDNSEIPIYRYNYSYISQELKRKHDIEISVPTIIDRAKRWGYYKERKKAARVRDRVVQ